MGIRRIDNIGVAVSDARAAAAFWRDRVGLVVHEAFDGVPAAATVHIGDEYLYVFESTGPVTPPHDASLGENPLGLDHISFTVDSVDEEHARLAAAGVAFDGEPETIAEWGLRLAVFRDPDGNLFYLVQSV